MRFIIFDCDGTLVDSQKAIMRGIHTAWLAEGLTPPLLSDVVNTIGLPLLEVIKVLNPQGNDAQNSRLEKGFFKTFDDTKIITEKEEPLYDGVIETLQTLKKTGALLAVVTGKGRRGLGKVLDRHNLHDLFVVTKTADCGAGKPNPQVLLEAMDEVGADKTNSVIIGDTTYDILMGKNAGIKSVGVSFGYHSVADLKEAGAELIVDAFTDLPNAIDKVLKG